MGTERLLLKALELSSITKSSSPITIPESIGRFAGGTAAVILAAGPTSDAEYTALEGSSSLCLSKEPDTRPLWKWLWHKITFKGENHKYDEDTRAFYFATDTSFGLKVGWDGTSGPYPDTLKLGYNRKELAYPPIFVKQVANCGSKTPHSDAEQKGKKDKKEVNDVKEEKCEGVKDVK